MADRRAAATTERLASTCSLLRVQAGRAPAALIPRSERDPQLRPNRARHGARIEGVDGGLGPRTQHSADYMKAHRTHTRKHPERAPNVHMPCHCSSLKANPKKIEKNIFRFCALLFRYSERTLNSLFGSGLTFARLNDGQDLHPETPGMCRLGEGRGEKGTGRANMKAYGATDKPQNYLCQKYCSCSAKTAR